MTKKTRFSPKKAINSAATLLLERKQDAALTSDEAKAALAGLVAFKDVPEAAEAARAAIVDKFAGTIRLDPADVTAIDSAVTAIAATAAPVHVLIPADVTDAAKAFADGLPLGKFFAGLFDHFKGLKPQEQAKVLKACANRPDTRDFSPDNILKVAGLWDEKPTSEDEQDESTTEQA